ncbi:MAG: DNA translocase FtsK [Prevotella sp.]|nr:DNA translocase FtsK [Bacteroides sp.]MCM1365660.1 DNA translocase FtsK [Prevotella sp.]
MKKYENFSPEIEDSEILETGNLQDTGRYNNKNTSHAKVKEQTSDRRRNAIDTSSKKCKAAKKTLNKTVRKSSADTLSIKDTVKEWANGKTLKLILGIFMALFAAYLSVSFVSYLTSCISDQSIVSGSSVGQGLHSANTGGEGGARIANFLINDTFGFGSIVIIIWLFAMSLKQLTGRPHFKSVNFTIKCIVALIALSMIVGLLTLSLDSVVNWGGYHGKYINEFVIGFLGWTGAVMLCLFMIAVFVVICLRDIANWILKLKRIRDKKRAEIEALKLEQEKKRKALLEDEERERHEAIASGEAPEIETATVNEHVLNFADKETLENGAEIIHEEEEYESYVLTDEDEIKRLQSGGTDACSNYSLEDESDDTCETTPSDAVKENESNALSTQNSKMDEEVMEIRTNTIAQGDETQPVSEQSPTRHPYTFPPIDILRPGKERINVDKTEQLANQERIRSTLLDFNISIDSIDATVGPTVTLYEIVPSKGVKVNTIINLADDIALRLAAIGVRIIAPIPGRGTIGIEVANKDPQIVSMRSIINSEKFRNSKYKLPIALGATIENDVYIADLAKMPHLLVAGATGQGKSVGLNAIIASLLYSKTPEQVKFVMIDPKMVEFSLYAKLESHYLAELPDESEPIITDMDKVVATLNSLCKEMDDRYKLLKGNSRNVEEYNEKVISGYLDKNSGHRFLPYIVVVVDEFADLIMTAGRDVEMPIARLAQKARAVGMHVIIATQRPSTKVITGNIKANFPARISFKVTSGVDSKTILDQTGAQQLIGRGDMLISNNSGLVRVQCAFIDTPEVEDIVNHISRQPYPPGAYILPEPTISVNDGEVGGNNGYGGSFTDDDPLLVEAGRSVVMANQASASSLQRRYSIGYNRAGKIMDQLEALGIVGPSQGGKPRTVLVDAETYEEIMSRR